MALLQILFLLSFFLSTSCGSEEKAVPFHVQLLMPRSGSYNSSVYCESWRLAVETNNILKWTEIPSECIDYVGTYMLGQQYKADSEIVANEASHYANSLNISGDAMDIWVFDIDETALSNLPYYVATNFGEEPYNATAFNEWVAAAVAPALPDTLRLYEELLSLGFKVVFITGRGESERNATTTNLQNAGYYTWEKLILKGSAYSGKTALYYKSKERAELEKDGYRITGNVGDQWSDLLGTNTGNRTFKLPDPMYYVS